MLDIAFIFYKVLGIALALLRGFLEEGRRTQLRRCMGGNASPRNEKCDSFHGGAVVLRFTINFSGGRRVPVSGATS